MPVCLSTDLPLPALALQQAKRRQPVPTPLGVATTRRGEKLPQRPPSSLLCSAPLPVGGSHHLPLSIPVSVPHPTPAVHSPAIGGASRSRSPAASPLASPYSGSLCFGAPTLPNPLRTTTNKANEDCGCACRDCNDSEAEDGTDMDALDEYSEDSDGVLRAQPSPVTTPASPPPEQPSDAIRRRWLALREVRFASPQACRKELQRIVDAIDALPLLGHPALAPMPIIMVAVAVAACEREALEELRLAVLADIASLDGKPLQQQQQPQQQQPQQQQPATGTAPGPASDPYLQAYLAELRRLFADLPFKNGRVAKHVLLDRLGLATASPPVTTTTTTATVTTPLTSTTPTAAAAGTTTSLLSPLHRHRRRQQQHPDRFTAGSAAAREWHRTFQAALRRLPGQSVCEVQLEAVYGVAGITTPRDLAAVMQTAALAADIEPGAEDQAVMPSPPPHSHSASFTSSASSSSHTQSVSTVASNSSNSRSTYTGSKGAPPPPSPTCILRSSFTTVAPLAESTWPEGHTTNNKAGTASGSPGAWPLQLSATTAPKAARQAPGSTRTPSNSKRPAKGFVRRLIGGLRRKLARPAKAKDAAKQQFC